MIAAALRPADIPSLVLAVTGAFVLLAIALRQRAGRPLLRPVETPFRPASPGRLLLLAAGVFLAYQMGGLLVLSKSGLGGDVLGIGVPLAASVAAAFLARREALLPRGTAAWRVGMGLLHVWAALPLVYAAYLVGRWAGLPEQQAVVGIRDRADGWQALALLALLVAPVAEEVSFRGLVYPALRRRLRAPEAILFSSLAFAFVHPPSVCVPMAILGAFLAWLVETTGSVLPCVAGHMAFNGVHLAQMLLFPA